ncbi:hypothetical protein JCM10207_000542 [Rhodosporidiobolus poonsookiae]
MSYGLKLSTPTQCETIQIAWQTNGDKSILQAWERSMNVFSEQLSTNLTGTLGSIEWRCDFPAGSHVAFQLNSLTNSTLYASSPYFEVQPGTTDDCLWQNPGQMRKDTMSSFAASLSTASPQLFTGYTTATTTTSSSSSTSSVSTTDVSSPTQSQSSNTDSVNIGAIVGGAIGGLAVALGAAALLFYLCARRGRSRSSGSRDGDKTEADGAEAGGAAAAAAGGAAAGGFFRRPRSANPIDMWRKRVEGGRPPSVWTRRSRFPSVSVPAHAAGDSISTTHGLSPQAQSTGGYSNPFASSADPALPAPSSGPRAGVPEVGEASDYPAYSSAYPTSGAPASAPGGYAAIPVSYPGMRYPPAAPAVSGPSAGALELLNDGRPGSGEGVIRPPTRLTTPGGLTAYGGDDVRGLVGAYESYSR